MEISEIEQLINDAIKLDELHVAFDGSQCKVIAVAEVFAELSRVKKQQAISKPLAVAINDGRIHALTVKTFTPEQWKKDKMFNLPL
ncbi:BolA family protein [Thalassotalea euphylliae]|uniref:BolA family transcriptional regulator n=1 Tax=Thalassotalea euphylliae TaxID=1655234 RepID=A0A3E0UE86_9GAMM|nr:BolA/IbaG family iron-sulfur metabolism protein [Thalassotalea euphylliae]REL30653.1 BolA family transcriptional regulator [Thalassotalea euphylliae]REL34415.1 BolA family transcriptional regulator [Thalassotalea euphylliae]